ncbi:class I SAM-dependent methyltransferase [Amnibacterium sp. CER49]|uniref:class I SAM-dependent methyltransferase n=1 Tax=Amnibacterium sp. CER49 TaxID=3039161 RepID=UPI00244AA4C0|nr:class I SAM-dependent methyltransferase [Amnibacterium sp. CER49]MDH2443467.1 class I SAM-dependent methyltransferase [Amnibacterium sp. CER49]
MDAHQWDARYAAAAASGIWAHAAPRIVQEVVATLPPGRALDLGCGDGRTTRLLAARGWTVTAVDFSAEALAIAVRVTTEAADRVTWLQADVTTLAPRAGQHLVVATYLHLPEPALRRVLATAAASLVPGGTLLVLGHDVENLATGAPGPTDPSLLYTPELLAGAVGGLEVVRCERVRRGPDDAETHGPVSGGEAVDTVLVATAPA